MKKLSVIFILVILTITLANAGDYRFQNLTGSDLMTIQGSNGFVGIRTATPSYKIDIKGDDEAGFFSIDRTGNAAINDRVVFGMDNDGSTDYFWIGKSSINRDFIFDVDNGRIGIGTSSPVTALDINGIVTATSFTGAGTGLTGTASSLTCGTASDLSCTNCISGTEIAELTDADISNTLTASDVVCTNCLTATEVASADTATSASGLVCTSCVGNTDIVDSAISQAKLKTSMGSVASSAVAGTYTYTLPGGQYGFYPQTRGLQANSGGYVDIAFALAGGTLDATYLTRVTFTVTGGHMGYAQQRYVTSSGEVFWIFILKDKITGDILGSYQAPDHPSFGNGGDPEKVEHPFPGYDQELHEIIVMNPSHEDIIKYRKESKTLGKDLLQYFNEDFTYEDIKNPKYPEEDGTEGYIPIPVTVGLVNDEDWNLQGIPVEIEKKIIKKPKYIKVKELVRK